MNEIFATTILDDCGKNEAFRRVVKTTAYQQITLMAVSDLIPREIHPYTTQTILIVEGNALARIGDLETKSPGKVTDLETKETSQMSEIKMRPGDLITIPPGTYHEVLNVTKQGKLKLISFYSPPLHPQNVISMTREEDEQREKKACLS